MKVLYDRKKNDAMLQEVKRMEIKVKGNTLMLVTDDITKQETEAIVNAANGTLLGGGGVDGAIHRVAGPELLAECKIIRQEQLQGEELPTGDAVITKGYKLSAQYIIHTVGPVWQGGGYNEEALLANCYKNSLRLAQQYKLTSIAFPSISTGVYRFPVDRASQVALTTLMQFLQVTHFGKVVMVLFSEEDYSTYAHTLQKMSERL